MIINPIIPIWVMAIICIILLCVKRKGTHNYIRQICMVILLFVINLRFMVLDGEVPSAMPSVNILFVVDNSISMLAEDYGDNKGLRIDAIKEDCNYIVEQFPGAYFSIVTFNDTVQRMIPYTTDALMVKDYFDVITTPNEIYARGTSLNKVMDEMKDILAGEKNSCTILFFITDGEIVNDDKLKSHAGLRQYVDGGAVLGYGTEKGGAMIPIDHYADPEEAEENQEIDEYDYLHHTDANGNYEIAISRIDEDNLKAMASDFGIDYVHMTDQSQIHKTIKKVQNKIDKLDVQPDEKSIEGYADIYYWFVIPLLVLCMIDFMDNRRKVWKGNKAA